MGINLQFLSLRIFCSGSVNHIALLVKFDVYESPLLLSFDNHDLKAPSCLGSSSHNSADLKSMRELKIKFDLIFNLYHEGRMDYMDLFRVLNLSLHKGCI